MESQPVVDNEKPGVSGSIANCSFLMPAMPTNDTADKVRAVNGPKLLRRRNKNNSARHGYEVKAKKGGESIEMKSLTGQGDYAQTFDATDAGCYEMNVAELSTSDNRIDIIESDSMKPADNAPKSSDMIKRLDRLNYDYCSFAFHVYSILTYCADICSDIVLVVQYHRQGDVIWSALTLTFVLVPGVTMTIFSLYWYCEDGQTARLKKCLLYRVVLHLCQMTPLVRYIDLIYCGMKMNLARYRYQDRVSTSDSHNSQSTKSKTHRLNYLNKAERYYQFMMDEELDAALLRMIECFMEAAPQLLLQLYLMLGSKQIYLFILSPTNNQSLTNLTLVNDSSVTNLSSPNFTTFYLQLVSCLTSWCAMGWCLTSYQRSLRFSLDNKAKLTMKALIVMCLWKLFVLSSRILALVLLALTFHQYVFLILGAHWLLMLFSIWIQQTQFCGQGTCRSGKEFLFIMVISEINCFEFLNVREGHTRLRYTLYYLIIYAENLAAVVLWYNFWIPPYSEMNMTLFYYIVGVIVIVGFLIGIIFMIIYYCACHPTGNIQMCLSLNDIKFWGSYELNSPPESNLSSINAQHSSTVVPQDSHTANSKKEPKSTNGSKHTNMPRQ